MTMTLIKFPLEILLQVCELLGDTHESSLLSFALTNKYCYSIASRLLFRTITFNITTLSRFRNDIRQCIRILRRDKAFQHVHRLVLSGCYDTFKLHKPSEDETEIDEGHAKPFNLHGWNLGPPLSVNWDVRHKRLRGIPDHSDFTNEIYAAKAAVNDVYEDDARWTPLADLIGLLPALDDLIYECPTQFPPCLLQALHTSPNDRVARLHLHTFKLRMLGRVDLATPVGATRDAHELALIKSPCLHAIWLSDRDERLTPEQEGESRLVGRQFDALEQILGNEGLAPNLREIRRKVTHSSSFDYLQPRPYTSGWLPKEVGPRSGKQQPAALRHLQLDCSMSHHQILGFQIHRWARLANLRSLETLELTTHVTECGLDAILSLDFPALRTLSFRCARDPDIGYHSKVKRFLARLPRLESLWIRGWDWSLASLAPDLDNGTTNDKDTSPSCNERLRKLWIDHRADVRLPYSRASLISPSEVSRLGAFYSRVDTLSISVRRSKGDVDEAARYKAIGTSFPRLQRLALTLDATAPFIQPVPRPKGEQVSFEDEWIQPWLYTNRHALDVMVNSALDDRLARQIFEAIASPTLETMMVRSHGGTDFKIPPYVPYFLQAPQQNQPRLRLFVDALSREWMVERLTKEREVKVKEIWRKAMQSIGRPETWHQQELDTFLPYFRRLWPDTKEGSKGWYEDWDSWPLAGATEDSGTPRGLEG